MRRRHCHRLELALPWGSREGRLSSARSEARPWPEGKHGAMCATREVSWRRFRPGHPLEQHEHVLEAAVRREAPARVRVVGREQQVRRVREAARLPLPRETCVG